MKFFLLFFGTIWLIVTVIMIPIQYRYLLRISKEMENQNKSQGEYYEDMPIQEEVLHGNSQGNFFFIPANFIAWLILKKKGKL